MNCEQVNQIDMVEYLSRLGFQAEKNNGKDYWYLSPLRDEKEPSFKVNKPKNVWYDHGQGKGGKLVDFAMLFFRCTVSELLQKFPLFQQQNPSKNIAIDPPFHLHKVDKNIPIDATETAIRIIAAKQPIANPSLCRYLESRKIDKEIADKYCYEVLFAMNDKERAYHAIGFKNTEAGYELRNEYFKGSSSPKAVTFFDNNNSKSITIFEGFFDFLTYQSINKNQLTETNFLVLNSLSFFQKQTNLMEKHNRINLYLDRDPAGKKITENAKKTSLKYRDKSGLYKGYKDLNEWAVKNSKLGQNIKIGKSAGRHL